MNVSNGDASAWLNDVYIDGSGNLNYYTYSGSGHTLTTTGVNYADGNVHAVAVRIDGTSKSIYVDGVLAATSAAGASNSQSLQQVNVGWAKTSGTPYFTGDVYDVQVYNSALSAVQIAEAGATNTAAAGVLVHYEMNTAGATLADTSGNSSTGTVNGGALSAVMSGKTFTLDNVTATAVAVTGISSDSGVAGDFVTNDVTLAINGTSDATVGARVELYLDGSKLGETTVGAGGAWSYDYSGVALAQGTYAVQAKVVDLAGNVVQTSGSQNVVVDTAAPATPSSAPASLSLRLPLGSAPMPNINSAMVTLDR